LRIFGFVAKNPDVKVLYAELLLGLHSWRLLKVVYFIDKCQTPNAMPVTLGAGRQKFSYRDHSAVFTSGYI
jgi:hypothetical protein